MGFNRGKVGLSILFIVLYIILGIIIYILSKNIADKKKKNASKLIRVFELSKYGLAVHQIAEVLENEGYRSILGRKTLEKSCANIIKKGSFEKALELNRVEYTELYNNISKNILFMSLRVVLIIIFLYYISIPDPCVEITGLYPRVNGPQEIGTDIVFDIKISKNKDFTSNYAIYVDHNKIHKDSVTGNEFSWNWNTSNAICGQHNITVEVFPENYYNKRDKWTTIYELYNQKPIINYVEYIINHNRSVIESNVSKVHVNMGAIAIIEVNATDPDRGDTLNYEFLVDGIVKESSNLSKWSMDTSNYDEGDYMICVKVTDGNVHANNLDVNKQVDLTINAVNILLKINGLFYNVPGWVSLDDNLSIFVPEDIVKSRNSAESRMQYKFYIDGYPLTSWQNDSYYIWDGKSRSYYNKSLSYNFSGRMRFNAYSKEDECDAETQICKMNVLPNCTNSR
jgi:hypothetical protein